MAYKLIAYSLKNGKCVALLECKNVDEREYNKLANELIQKEDKEQQEKVALNKRIDTLEGKVKELINEIKKLRGEL